jgi:hypothetical protein
MPAPVSDLPVIPNFPIQQPMNFTGLPNIPVMPNIPVHTTAQYTTTSSQHMFNQELKISLLQSELAAQEDCHNQDYLI